MLSIAETIEVYAELIVKVGVNLQDGQNLYVNSPAETLELARAVAKKAYQHGARNVYVDLGDDELALIRMSQAPEEGLKDVPNWRVEQLKSILSEKAATVSIYAPNPDLLKDISPDRIALSNRTGAIATRFFSEAISKGEISWTIVAAPTKAWAAKVFPDLPADEGMAQLWDAICKIVRLDQPNSIEAWQVHGQSLQERAKRLTEKSYRQLRYKAPGTDLTIDLDEKHKWTGGGSVTQSGLQVTPNMPTEEVFTLPSKRGVNGVVRNTLPLNYSGSLIDGFSLTFKDGQIVDFTAEQGYDTLKHLLDMDEGSRYLGEVALVPYDSPISQSGLLFYNTLYDENASCHLAIGRAYPPSLDGGAEMDEQTLAEHGFNSSIMHVDFMMGSAELDIDGVTADGTVEPVFRNGTWTF